MSETWWWKAEPPPNGNKGNPWFVRDGDGNVQAIISHTVPGIDEKTAKYIAALGTSCVGHERRADQAEAALAITEAEVERLRARNARLEVLYKALGDIYFRRDESPEAQNRVADAFLDASTQQLTWNSPDGPVTAVLAAADPPMR